MLQDKERPETIVPVRLGPDGSAAGDWPAAWTDAVRQRAAGWLARLRAALPGLPRDEEWPPDGLALDDEAAWRFLSADSVRLVAAGWQVLLPGWWEDARRAKPRRSPP